MDGKLLTEKLIRYAKKFLYLEELDERYVRNLLLREFRLNEPSENADEAAEVDGYDVPDKLTSEIKAYAEENGLCDGAESARYATYIFGLLTPMPSKVNAEFYRIKNENGIEAALSYFYGLSVRNDYVQKTAIARNIMWEYCDGANTLEITINLSKPEKDNKDIAKLVAAPVSKGKYPKCLLCKENEGFEGNANHPARGNIRTVSMNLGGEKWFVQYSPYAYYEEHCIAISYNHTPMKVDGNTVEKLFDFVDTIPTYFIGSNAALPIVGGSILNHEHFQGGKHILPMQKAEIAQKFECKKYSGIDAGIVDWYNSCIRLSGKNRKEVQALATEIIEKWRNYNDENCGIISYSDGANHNTLAPIARKTADGKYVLDMILRNNRADEKYPDGIFHAHPEYHNIKKEGIGLIEAMGMFILPGRLKRQTAEIVEIMTDKTPFNYTELSKTDNPLYVHREMIKTLCAKKYESEAEAQESIKGYINAVCAHILDNTAVFKRDENGKKGFLKFMKEVGLEVK